MMFEIASHVCGLERDLSMRCMEKAPGYINLSGISIPEAVPQATQQQRFLPSLPVEYRLIC